MGPITKRVFIIPIGLELFKAKYTEVSPDFVYLITQHEDPSQNRYDGARQNVEEVFNHFNQINPTVFGVDNYFNLFELMSIYRHICEIHAEDYILINVGSGSKLTAIAGFVVSNWYDNAVCYYPKTKITVNSTNELYAKNEVENVIEIQPFPIKKLDPNLIPVLNYLKDDARMKKEILNFLIDKGKIKEYFTNNKGENKQRSPQSLYNLLKRNYLSPLEDDGLIMENNDGEIILTDQGENFQIIFGKSAEEFYYEQI